LAHQEATLTGGNPQLGAAGTAVTITKVEQFFSDSHAANNGIGYRCSDCNVAVKAVITIPTRSGRKTSPSSYFRASRSCPHHAGCKRGMREVESPSRTTGGTRPASPTKALHPTKWTASPLFASGTSGGSRWRPVVWTRSRCQRRFFQDGQRELGVDFQIGRNVRAPMAQYDKNRQVRQPAIGSLEHRGDL
jgi:hypothetical protein